MGSPTVLLFIKSLFIVVTLNNTNPFCPWNKIPFPGPKRIETGLITTTVRVTATLAKCMIAGKNESLQAAAFSKPRVGYREIEIASP
jgi:hypothetical protein